MYQAAKDAAAKLAQLTDEASKKDKASQDAYNSLNQQLDNAWLSAKTAQDSLKEKQVEIDTVTDQANKAAARADVEAARKKRYRKFLIYSLGVNVIAGLWIFKKPLLMMAGGMGGI